MTEKTIVRRQHLVNFHINIVIRRNVPACQALKLFIYNFYANRRLRRKIVSFKGDLRNYLPERVRAYRAR